MPSALDKKKLAALVAMIESFDQKGYVDENFEKALKTLLEYVAKVKAKNAEELNAMRSELSSALANLQSSVTGTTSEATKTLVGKVEEALNRMTFEHEAMMAEAKAVIDEVEDGLDGMDGKDGKDADEEEIVKNVLMRIPEPEIDLSGIEEKIGSLEKQIASKRTAPFFGPSRGIFLDVNGVKQGITSNLNVVGSGVSITKVNGLPTITITGGTGSGSTAVETPTGAVNGSNASFTVAHEPLYIIVDGISKFVTLHYTYAGGTITITDGAPPTQYIRSVYSA